MKKLLSIAGLLFLSLTVGAQTASNYQKLLHGQFEITDGGDGAAKSLSRVELVDDVFGHRLTVLGVDMETGKETVDEYAVTEIRPTSNTVFYSGVIVGTRIEPSGQTITRNFVYNKLKDNSYKLNFEGQLLTLERIVELQEAKPRPATTTTPAAKPSTTTTTTTTVQRPSVSTSNSSRPTTATTKPAAAYGTAAASPYANKSTSSTAQQNSSPIRIPSGATAWPNTPLKGDIVYFRVKGIPVYMKLVSENEFMMGCGVESADHVTPIHSVAITRSYYIMTTEVTQELWLAVMGSFPEGFKYKGAKYPMTGITWSEARNFCSVLRQQSNLAFALPTEAQWELAAKGAQMQNDGISRRYSGSSNIDDVAWYKGNTSAVHEVSARQANRLGLYDMSGNVAEWVLDEYGPYTNTRVSNGTGQQYPTNGTGNRIVRGGSVIADAKAAQPQQRQEQYSGTRSDYIGFRMVINN